MKMLYVKNKIISESSIHNTTQTAWLYAFPYLIIYPTEMEEGSFRKISVIEIGWLHWSLSFYFNE